MGAQQASMGNENTESGPTERREHPIDIESKSPAGVFGILASKTRIEILEALGDPPGEKSSFA